MRIDPDLALSIEAEGVLGRPALRKDQLVFTYKRKQTVRIEGPRERLELLLRLLEGRKRVLPEDLEAVRLPRDLKAFATGLASERNQVRELLLAGRSLVEVAERVVCRLYGIPRDLEDEVVAHAVARSGGEEK